MSALSSSMNIAVSALYSQSAAVSCISNNLANSSTTGYKTTTAAFATMVSGSGSYTNFTGAGVKVDPRQSLTSQGTLVGTESSTDLGIDGEGFFVVAANSTSNIFYYTRAGDFTTDESGYLVNSAGWYLQGYPTDRDGNVLTSKSAAGLQAINVDDYAGTAEPTTKLEVQAVLPAEAEVGDAFTVDAEIFDSLGVSHTITVTYTKTGVNAWEMSVSDPVMSSTGTASGTASLNGVAGGTAAITFDTDGTLLTPATIDLGVTGWTTGAGDSTITYTAGTIGGTDGLSQFGRSDSNTDPKLTLKAVVQDGLRFGEFVSVTIGTDGTVSANFDNGVSYSIYKIPLAMFANANGLDAKTGTVFSSSIRSGTANLVEADSGASGAILSGEVESSTTDTASEFSKMIVAQQAYSAASEIISTVSDMYDALLAAKR